MNLDKIAEIVIRLVAKGGLSIPFSMTLAQEACNLSDADFNTIEEKVLEHFHQ